MSIDPEESGRELAFEEELAITLAVAGTEDLRELFLGRTADVAHTAVEAAMLAHRATDIYGRVTGGFPGRVAVSQSGIVWAGQPNTAH